MELTTAMVRGYHDAFELLLQQKGGVLSQYVRVESQKVEKDFYEQMGSVVAEQVSTRFPESPVSGTPLDRRMVTITPFHVGDFVDSFEKIKTLADPKAQMVQNFVSALGRERDRLIFQAIYGTTFTGKEGTTSTTWPTTVSTDAGGVRVDEAFGGSAVGLTLEKLIEAKRAWLANFNDPSDESPFIIINSDGTADLLNTTEVQSADYNSIKTLVQGDVDTFMGFKFVGWEGYVVDGKNVMRSSTEVLDRYPVLTKSSIINAVGMDVETRISERNDRSFMWYAYARAMFGAARMQEKKIVEIEAARD